MLITKIRNWLLVIKSYLFPENISKKRIAVTSLLAFFFSLSLVLLFVPPLGFPVGNVIEIKSGESLQSVTLKLHEHRIIRSELFFRSLVILFGGEKKVIAGDYLLSEKQGTFGLARRLVNGKFWIDTIRVTIPEGWNIYQIGDYLEKNLIQFDKREFLLRAKSMEGYLFPDTYFVRGSINPTEIIKMMNDNFQKKIATMQESISKSKYKLSDIIIMASILEGEALPPDRSIVAGILWKRLEIGMALQVDATFAYINGKDTYELTLDDLKIDSLYNTYKYRGLPPTPINNPGLGAIVSAMSPTKTKYLYFLSSRDGKMYYATTFEEHQVNREKYLR